MHEPCNVLDLESPPSHRSIPPEKQRLRSGFPPRELKPPSEDPSLPVNLANGERVSVDVIGPVEGVAGDKAGLRAEAGSASRGGSGEGVQGGGGGRGRIKSGEEQAQQCKLTSWHGKCSRGTRSSMHMMENCEILGTGHYSAMAFCLPPFLLPPQPSTPSSSRCWVRLTSGVWPSTSPSSSGRVETTMSRSCVATAAS